MQNLIAVSAGKQYDCRAVSAEKICSCNVGKRFDATFCFLMHCDGLLLTAQRA